MTSSTGAEAAVGLRQHVAAPLRPALAQLAAELAPLDGLSDIERYRRDGAARREPIENIAQRRGLLVERTSVASLPALRLRLPRSECATIVFLHGGGMVAGTAADGVDVVARHADALGVDVVSLEYPLAPEHRLDDAADAVAAAIEELAASGRPLVLAGHSGGGSVALAAAERLRDGVLAGLLLICPMLGFSPTASRTQFADDAAWGARADATAWEAALGADQPGPGTAASAATLPSTCLDVGSAELFRDEAISTACRLLAAGVQVELHVWSGAFHASDLLTETSTTSLEQHRVRRGWLARLIEASL